MSKTRFATILAIACGIGAVLWWQPWRSAGPSVSEQPADPQESPASGTPAAKKRGQPQRQVTYRPDPKGNLTLEGFVYNTDKREVAGAEITINSIPRRTAHTGADGSFVFDNLVGRTYMLHARKGTSFASQAHELTATSEPAQLTLRPGNAVTVHVVSAKDNQPIANAMVGLGSALSETQQTDAKGLATFAGVAPGWNSVSAHADGYGMQTRPTQIPATRSDTPIAITLALEAGAPIRGTVQDEAGDPVASARLRIKDMSSLSGGGLATAMSDAKGDFAFPAIAAGNYRIVAVHPEYAPSTSRPLTANGTTPVDGVVLQLRTGGKITGRVIAEGQAVAWAKVGFAAVGQSQENLAQGIVQVTADQHGVFEARGLPRRKIELLASSALSSSEVVTADLETQEQIVDLEIALDVTGVIAGRVVDDNGEPVEAAQVTAMPASFTEEVLAEFRLRGPSAMTTDPAGEFQFRGLPEGAYRIRASRDAQDNQAFMYQGTPATTGDTQVQVILKAPGKLRGRVVRADGGPVQHFSVAIAVPPGTQFSTKDGAFTMDNVRAGKHDILISGPGFTGRSVRNVDITPGKTVDIGTIKVSTGRVLTGQVVDKNGSPVAGATVVSAQRIVSDGKNLIMFGGGMDEQLRARRSQTDDNGMYKISGIAASDTLAAAEHPELGRAQSVLVPRGDGDVRQNLVLEKTGGIRGTVTLGGKPAGTMTIIINAYQAARVSIAHQYVVRTGSDGRYAIEAIVPGHYTVMAAQGMGGADKTGTVSVDVVAGKVVQGDIEIATGSATLIVAISGKDGAIIDFAQVLLLTGSVAPTTGAEAARLITESPEALTSQQNIFPKQNPKATFRELVAGAYNLCVIPINGDITNPSFSARLQENADQLAVYCTKIEIQDGEQTHDIAVPPMTPLPQSDDSE